MTISDSISRQLDPQNFAEGEPIIGPSETAGIRRILRNVNYLHRKAVGAVCPGSATATAAGHDHDQSGSNGGALLRRPKIYFVGFPGHPFHCSTYRSYDTDADYVDSDKDPFAIHITPQPRVGLLSSLSPAGDWLEESTSGSEFVCAWNPSVDTRGTRAATNTSSDRWIHLHDAGDDQWDGRYLVRAWVYNDLWVAGGSTGGVIYQAPPTFGGGAVPGSAWQYTDYTAEFNIFIPPYARVMNVFIPLRCLYDYKYSDPGTKGPEPLDNYILDKSAIPPVYDMYLYNAAGDGPSMRLSPENTELDGGTDDLRYQVAPYVPLTYDVSALAGAEETFEIRFKFNSQIAGSDIVEGGRLHSINFGLWHYPPDGPAAPIYAAFDM